MRGTSRLAVVVFWFRQLRAAEPRACPFDAKHCIAFFSCSWFLGADASLLFVVALVI